MMRGTIKMSPNNGNGSGNDDKPKRKKTPTDGVVGHSAVKKPGAPGGSGGGGSDDDTMPMQVVLAKGTFLKFAITIGGTVLVGISAILAVYWQHHYQVTSHMGNGTIHLKSGERATLETKKEAQKNRAKLVEEVKREVTYQHRTLKLRQDEEIKKGLKGIGDELKQSQRSELRKLLEEVKRTRRAVGRVAPPHP